MGHLRESLIRAEMRALIEASGNGGDPATAEKTAGERAARRGRRRNLEAVAHDLREPLHTIRLAASALGEYRVVDDARRDRLMGAILRSADMMSDLIANLLEGDRYPGGWPALHPELVDLDAFLAQTRDRFRLEAEQRGVVLTTALPTGPPLRARADRGLLDRILSNLVRNALEHAGGDRVTLAAAAGGDGTVRLAVRDTGCGIPPQERKRLFRPTSSGPVERREGRGLGLAIVRANVELLGGRVWLESQVGQGTTFYFTIPAED